jgi:hypothetical protein
MENYSLDPFCHYFNDEFHGRVQQRNGLEVNNSFWIRVLGHQGYERVIDTLQVNVMVEKTLYSL